MDRLRLLAYRSHVESSCEDKKKNMSSLFAWKRNATPEMLSLPAFCTPTSEAESLRKKRDAQLEWMRTHGVRSLLGTPITRAVSWSDVTVEAAKTVPAQRVAQRAAAALHTLRRLNTEQAKSAGETASGKAA